LPYAKTFPQLWALVLDGSLNFVAAIIILIVGWTFAGWASKWIRAAVNRISYVDRTLRPLIASVTRYAIIVFTIVAVLERFGVQTTSIIATLGAAGLAIGLAIQGTLSNVASGVMLLMLRSMRAGEEVTTSGYSGVVREVGLFRTVLVTGDGLYVSVPNATIFSNPIVNNSREPVRQIHFKIVIDHAADIGAAQSAALSVMHADTRVLKNPPPAAPVVELGEQDVTIAIQAWVPTATYGTALAELQKLIWERVRKAGIERPHAAAPASATSTPESAAGLARRRSA
jgi:small conductance mechanosensitive channel